MSAPSLGAHEARIEALEILVGRLVFTLSGIVQNKHELMQALVSPSSTATDEVNTALAQLQTRFRGP